MLIRQCLKIFSLHSNEKLPVCKAFVDKWQNCSRSRTNSIDCLENTIKRTILSQTNPFQLSLEPQQIHFNYLSMFRFSCPYPFTTYIMTLRIPLHNCFSNFWPILASDRLCMQCQTIKIIACIGRWLFPKKIPPLIVNLPCLHFKLFTFRFHIQNQLLYCFSKCIFLPQNL